MDHISHDYFFDVVANALFPREVRTQLVALAVKFFYAGNSPRRARALALAQYHDAVGQTAAAQYWAEAAKAGAPQAVPVPHSDQAPLNQNAVLITVVVVATIADAAQRAAHESAIVAALRDYFKAQSTATPAGIAATIGAIAAVLSFELTQPTEPVTRTDAQFFTFSAQSAVTCTT